MTKCAIETWWGGHRKWQPCSLGATEGPYCAGHAWANRFPPFWDEGSALSGSLIHRTRTTQASSRPTSTGAK